MAAFRPGPSESKQLIWGDREVADALAGRMKDRIGNCRCDPHHGYFAHTLDAQRVYMRVLFVGEQDVHHRRRVRVNRDRIFRKIAVRHPSVAGIDHTMLHQSHTDPADHAPNALAARGLRIDDATDAIGADHSPDARFPKIRVDGDLDEEGAKGVFRELLARVGGRHIGRYFNRLVQPAHRCREVGPAATCQGLVARFAARRLDRAPDAGHCHRAAMGRGLGKPAIAEDEFHPVHRQAKRICRHLGHGCPGARSHIARCGCYFGSAIR
nr:acylaldehyde oxidase [uncultured bacterium]